MTMPPRVLQLAAHIGDFLADIERGRRPDWNTVQRASFRFCSLKLELHALPRHEIPLVTDDPDDPPVPSYTDADDLVPPPDARRAPGILPATGFTWHDQDDYPAHDPGANPPLDPGNE